MSRHKVPHHRALTHDIKTRVTTAHYERLQRQLASTHYRTMSEMLRAMICEGKITVVTVDATLTEAMEKLVLVKRELNAIGNNLNQVARALNSNQGHKVLHLVEMLGLIKTLSTQMQPLKDTISALSSRWLSGQGESSPEI